MSGRFDHSVGVALVIAPVKFNDMSGQEGS